MTYFVARQAKGIHYCVSMSTPTHVVNSCVYANNNKTERIVAFPKTGYKNPPQCNVRTQSV